MADIDLLTGRPDLVPYLERLAQHLGQVCQTRADADDWIAIDDIYGGAVAWLEGRNALRVSRAGGRTSVKLSRDSVIALKYGAVQGLINAWT
jgi:hypothetical protein